MEDFDKVVYNDVVVIVINLSRGTLNECRRLGNLLDDEIVSGCKKLVVDLGQCEFIDSSFIGTLVIQLKRIKEQGGNLKLVLPTIQRGVIFAVTNTLGFFETYKSRKEAIDSFSSE
jgi:anti-anti-sigma factor